LRRELIAQGKLKVFHQEISAILRHYVERRFLVRAPEKTSEEFLAEVQGLALLHAGQKRRLAEFLRQCDLVKFAGHHPEGGESEQTIELCRSFIEETAARSPETPGSGDNPEKKGGSG
jgi:hypothetical protein